MIIWIIPLLVTFCTCNLLNQTTIDHIKQTTHLWNPHDAFLNPLRHKTEEQLRAMLGSPVVQEDDHSLTRALQPISAGVPQQFDSRQQWPNCNYEIQDQQQCGSCVYFSSAIYLGQRFCKETNGSINVLLSPQYTLNCDANMRDQKCKGAYLDSVNQFLVSQGTVEKSCVNYVSGSGDPKTYERCNAQCRDGRQIGSAMAPLYKCKNLKLFNNVQAIQEEIMKNGAVQAQYNVYSDFYNYKSGIYHYTSGYMVGGHAVVLLGWGQENGVNYWIVQNQWGASFGEKGFFRIAFGQVGIDSGVYACQPVLQSEPKPEPVKPEPKPPAPPQPSPVDCQKQVQTCLKAGRNISDCNKEYFNCIYGEKKEL